MQVYSLKSLFKISFLFLPFCALSQTDPSLKNNNSNKLKKDTTLPAIIQTAADPKLKGNGLKKFLVGKNYRKEWIVPVEAPLLDLNKAYGGLTPKKLSGGKETKSLRIEDSAGREWTLRTVEKFPENAVPLGLRKTIAEKIIKDGISGSYPYGALSMSTLSTAVNVPFLEDSLVYVPDSPALGEFSSSFKNFLVLMENRLPAEIIKANEQGKKEKILSTGEIIYELANDNNSRVDQASVLRARLLDNFVMDFDRHEEQWDWFGIDSSGIKFYYPLPHDRDQVFYLSRGLLSKLLASKNMIPETQGFRAKAKEIRTFNRTAQDFDRFFLTSLSKDQWLFEIDKFLNSINDSVIESAMKKQPKGIQKYSAEKIIKTLKQKRAYFRSDMMRYYRFLSKTVSIVGTNKPEKFSISEKEDMVSVVVNKIDSAGNISSKLYERVFDPDVTKEIRIYGLEGDDKFVFDGGQSKIKIRLIGGPGNDEFKNNGNGPKVLAYDVSFEQNIFSGDRRIRRRISTNPENNSYIRLGYHYDSRSFGLSMEYSGDGGLYIGPKLKIIKQGFRKEPYGISQLLAVNRAINSSSYHIKYNVDLIKVFGNTDLLFRGDATLPTSRTLFFGIGNRTLFDKSKPGVHKFYLAHYDLVNMSLMARNNANSWFQYKYGPVFQYFKLRSTENENRYISTLYPDSGISKMQYLGKFFAGGELGFEINTKNGQLMPTRGVDLNIYGRSMAGLNNVSHSIFQAGGDISFYTDFISKKHVVLATSFGASHLEGKYELEQAQYLGFKENLRGFRIDRFAGRSRAYNNSEIRLIKNDVNFGLFRGSFGFLAFNDVGRVWTDQEKSTTWHDGYGWGILIAPLNRLVITASLMYSNEEKNLALINFGFQF